MRKLAIVSLLLAVVTPAIAADLVVNGDWNTFDETGWTRWQSPWAGGNFGWSVDPGMGVPAPSGHLQIVPGGQASFGWWQKLTVVPGTAYTLTADWSGSGVQWSEVLFFNDDGRGIYDQLDAPGATSIIAKHDDGSLGPNTWAWEPITTAGNQLNPNTIVATGNTMYVGLKLGGFGGNRDVWFDNISVTPEPTTMLLLGIPAVLLRRRRA